MKKIYSCIILVSFISISNYAYSQKQATGADSSKVGDSTKLAQVSKQLTEILDRLKNAEINEKQQVGVIEFDNAIPTHLYMGSPLKKTGRTISIDKISLYVKDGYIVEIQVFSGTKKFTNHKAPISITTSRFSGIDNLRNVKDVSEYIRLQEILSFNAFNSYLPDDGLIWLTPTHKSDTLTKNVGINSVVDVRLYTDALGIFGRTPNGIIQTDIRFKQFLHRKNNSNSGRFYGQYVKLNFNASKFDSKKHYEDSATFSRTGLMQKASVNAEVAFNVFTDWVEKKSLSTFYIDFGGGISISDLARLKDTLSITTQNIFTEIGFNLRSSSNVGMDLYSRFIMQYSPQTDFDNHGGQLFFLRGGGEVYWNPFGDAANRLFGRINYTFCTKKVEKKNHFSQVQFGYSVLLTKLAGKK